jgi:IMP cyclohydrolase
MKRNNAFFSFVKLDDYRVLIIGGHDGEKYLKSVYEIDLEHETIQDYEDLKTERFF